jgi:MFS family permease
MTSRDITRTLPFWVMFSVSILGGISNSATTPAIPAFVAQTLGGGSQLSGLLVSLSALTSIVAMPLGGSLADRWGYRRVAVCGIVLSSAALALMAVVPQLPTGAQLPTAVASRVLFGLGNAAALALMLTWTVALTPAAQRGKALSIYGLSVWVGLAAGPQVATAVMALTAPWVVFAVCATLELGILLLFWILPPPAPATVATTTSPIPTVGGGGAPVRGAPGRGVRALTEVLRAVWVPGVAAAVAWCGEGLMLAFLIVHLGAAGVPAAGAFGSASVFGVFAGSAIVARLLLARMPDRLGPLRAASISLVFLCAGLATIALAESFAVAAVGAVLMGIGFSPLYPSLTMLATRGLRSRNRALGLGMFSSFTSMGYAAGALLGGWILAVAPSTWAFLLVAGLQLVALAVLVVFTPDAHPRPRLAPGDPQPPLR